jgi:two-component system LytT family response regulator
MLKKVIIIDDELMARNLLQGMLNEFCVDIEVVDVCENLPSGISSIRKNHPDIVFLDIEMPEYSGLEILNFFAEEEVNFSIVFTTSYNDYAIRAFKLSAVDYLLKPISPEDLINSIKLCDKRNSKNSLKSLRNYIGMDVVKKIPIHTPTSIVYIKIDDILFFKGEGAYTKIFLQNETTLVTSKGLKYFEELLVDEKQFLRTHKSFIANINYVSEFVKSNGGYLIIKEYEVSISSDKMQTFLELIKL